MIDDDMMCGPFTNPHTGATELCAKSPNHDGPHRVMRWVDVYDAEHHGDDTDKQVFFYERDFYIFSNFSAFNIWWMNRYYDTSEHAYQCMKFPDRNDIASDIYLAPSAHEAFKIAERHRSERRPDWDDVKVSIMKGILHAKADQHEYVYRKLMATGDRELIEDSWRDDFWGWGPKRDGKNMLGKLWMEVRDELRRK